MICSKTKKSLIHVSQLLVVLVTLFLVPGIMQAQSTITLKGGGEMYYEDTGSGEEVVLFIHGHTLDRRM